MADQSWGRFRAFTSLEQEMHQLVERVGGRSWIDGFGWRPDTDLYCTETAFVVQTELPGIDATRDLEITDEDNVLRVSGRIVQAHDVTEADRLITERRYGPFHREVMLPEGVDPFDVSASFGNGVLTVRVAWPPESNDRIAAEPVWVDIAAESTAGLSTPASRRSSVSRIGNAGDGPEMGEAESVPEPRSGTIPEENR